MKRANRGFTLVEALVATALVALGIAGTVGGYGSLTRAQSRVQERERMQQLALAKYDEIVALGLNTASPSGNFEDWNEDRYQWEAEIEPSGIESLDEVRVIVRVNDRDDQVVVQGLVFTPPTTTEGQ